MNMHAGLKSKGFTLLEMLLVIVLIAMTIYIFMAYIQRSTLQQKIDRTAEQMQQILSAATSYYVMHNAWPESPGFQCLQGGSSPNCVIAYIPLNTVSPWGGNPYRALQAPAPNGNSSAGMVFYVWVTIVSQTSSSAADIAQVIAGKLPLSYVSSSSSANAVPPPLACGAKSNSCTVVASINIPVTNLNNATGVSFSGLYRHGACVPVPQCPVSVTNGVSMIPQVFVVPVSVSGLAEGGSSNSDVYPIESFSAYATGTGTNLSPPNCSQTSQSPSGGSNPCTASESPTGYFWRACLQIYTENGLVNTTNASKTWGDQVQLMAFTRCAVTKEPSGSAFTVYQ